MPNLTDIAAPTRLFTRDCDQFNAWSEMAGWETDYQQLGGRAFEGWFEASVSDTLRIGHRYCNRDIVVTGVPPTDCVPLILLLNRGEKGIFQGKAIGDNEAAIMCPGSEATYRSPAHLRLMSVSIPVSRLRMAFEAVADCEADPFISDTRAISLPNGAQHILAQLARRTISLSRGSATSVCRQEIEQQFISTFIAGLVGPPNPESGGRARRHRTRCVKTAREYIEANLSAPLGLEALARETRVSPRTLEYAFRDVLDTTLLRYIKSRRLHAARRRLLNTSDPPATVSAVAFSHGFDHMGYFARDYRAFFGESPSETLRRTVLQ